MFSFGPLLLTLQKYRHVDNIMFENHTVADRFLDFWRKTGNQHFGYLYGRYTEHKDIPLGIRAEVAAIYEPPQVGLLLGGLCCLCPPGVCARSGPSCICFVLGPGPSVCLYTDTCTSAFSELRE